MSAVWDGLHVVLASAPQTLHQLDHWSLVLPGVANTRCHQTGHVTWPPLGYTTRTCRKCEQAA